MTQSPTDSSIYIVEFTGALGQLNIDQMSVSAGTAGTVVNGSSGWLSSTVDPKGIETLNDYDGLGRTTKTIADYKDGDPSDADDQTTAYTYTGGEQVLTMKAVLPAGAFQETKYIYDAEGGCTHAVVREVNAAKTTLLIQAYSFTSTPIASAVAKAHDRGVKVTVVLDKSNQTDKYSAASYLFDHGIPTFIDAKHAIAHNKVMVIDGQEVLTGSFNFTKQAEDSNAENMVSVLTTTSSRR